MREVLTVLLGGARSGKSTLAVRLAVEHESAGGPGRSGGVTFVATCPRIAGDTDLAARIAAHVTERPASWRTVEEEHDLAGAIRSAGGDMVVVDCLTLWVSNLLHRGDAPGDIDAAARDAVAVAAARSAPTVVVTNEVGLGIVPGNELTRTYRDVLGRVNQRWVDASDRALLLVAGRAVALRPVDELL